MGDNLVNVISSEGEAEIEKSRFLLRLKKTLAYIGTLSMRTRFRA